MKDEFESSEDYLEFCKVFDESEQKLFENIRFKLGKEFKTEWGHNTVYNIRNFKNGTLEALEKTRRDLSCESAEKLIDLCYTLGYANKRIMYIVWMCGYINISFRDLRKYISQNKRRLEAAYEKYMAELEEKKLVLFQEHQKEVLELEQKTLKILMSKLEQLQNHLDGIDPIENKSEFKTTMGQIEKLEDRIKRMHCIEEKRDASVEISKTIEIKRQILELENRKPEELTNGNEVNPDARLLD